MHMKRRHALGYCLLACLGTPVFAAGCQDAPKKPPSNQPLVLHPVAPGAYADGPAGLHKLWSDLSTAARKEQPEKVISLLSSLTLTRDELTRLLGSEAATAHWPRYQAMMSELTHLGGLELVEQIQHRHFDEVVVLLQSTQPPAELTATERKVQHALVEPVPLYSVRLKRAAEPRGIRYEFFVYLDGRWRTGSLLGQVLPAEPAAAPAAK
jgi:hypothetical protein